MRSFIETYAFVVPVAAAMYVGTELYGLNGWLVGAAALAITLPAQIAYLRLAR